MLHYKLHHDEGGECPQVTKCPFCVDSGISVEWLMNCTKSQSKQKIQKEWNGKSFRHESNIFSRLYAELSSEEEDEAEDDLNSEYTEEEEESKLGVQFPANTKVYIYLTQEVRGHLKWMEAKYPTINTTIFLVL